MVAIIVNRKKDAHGMTPEMLWQEASFFKENY